ncbi:MAG TPA: beta-propeller domain-containing protein, partial [Pyrinomonadaceae bacterium]
MSKSLVLLAAAWLAVSNLAGCAGGGFANAGQTRANFNNGAKKTLRAFRSEQELADYFRKLAEEQKREMGRQRRARRGTAAKIGAGAPLAAPAASAEAVTVTATADAQAKSEDESVTNVQHAGVDEGGIVKVRGEHLVVLRRGRLFTVRIGGDELRPISAVDAFGPDIDPSNAWYDEMLVSNDSVVVIGYSYERGGTEVGLFHIDPAGRLIHRDTYHLRSNDYYSSRNYASRLIGSKLIFYTPLYLNPYGEDYGQAFPAVRRWRRGAKPDEFRRIVAATRVYRPERELNAEGGMALHTVTVCDLARGDLACEATAVLGAPGRVFYVSPESVYVWTTDWPRWDAEAKRRAAARSTLYRMPLDGSAPSALGVAGSPVDQFSFLESADRHLNVLVRSGGGGEAMWSSEVSRGDVALLRVPVDSSFADGTTDAPPSSYRRLPTPEGYTFQNRFVGDFVLYGMGSGWGRLEQGKGANLYAVRWAGGGGVDEIGLPHGVDRIEQMGRDAVVVGSDGRDLHFTGVRLGARAEA